MKDIPSIPWGTLPVPGRPITVDDIRFAGASFPPPGRQTVQSSVGLIRPAATLVPVIDVDGAACVVLTQRSPTMTYHRGDWVFPGGRVDPGVDADGAAAARREADEELGIARDRIDIVGMLDTHGPILSGFLIEVFVGIVPVGVELRPDPAEVADVAVVDLTGLLAADAWFTSPDLPDDHHHGPMHGEPDEGERGDLLFFRIHDDQLVWGTQANIIWNLLSVVVPTMR